MVRSESQGIAGTGKELRSWRDSVVWSLVLYTYEGGASAGVSHWTLATVYLGSLQSGIASISDNLVRKYYASRLHS